MGTLVGPDGREIECDDTLNKRVKHTRVLIYEGPAWWIRMTLSKSIQERLEIPIGATITVESDKEEEVK
jgi:hypothetical protein